MKGQARGSGHKLQQGKSWLSIRKSILRCEGGGAGAKSDGGCVVPVWAPEQHDPALKLGLPWAGLETSRCYECSL